MGFCPPHTMEEPPYISAPVAANPLPSLLFLKGHRTTTRTQKLLLNYNQMRRKTGHFQKTGKANLWPKPSPLVWVIAKATTNPQVPALENPEQSSQAAPQRWTFPSGQRHSQDLDLGLTTTRSPPPLKSPQNKLLLFTQETGFWVVGWGFFSYKTSSKTEIMKNRSILKTPPAVLEREREKKKQKFNNAAAGRKGALP